MTAATERHDMIAPADTAEATDRTDAKEPMDPIEKAEPTEPMDMKEFLDAIERRDPVENKENLELVEAMNARYAPGWSMDRARWIGQELTKGTQTVRTDLASRTARAHATPGMRWRARRRTRDVGYPPSGMEIRSYSRRPWTRSSSACIVESKLPAMCAARVSSSVMSAGTSPSNL